jgi:very-short-patch-repair endonuclease
MMAHVWQELCERQHRVVTRRQALQHGYTSGRIRRRLETGAWRRLSAGVYVTYTGPIPRIALLWAAVLAAGPGAMLSHDTAAELVGLSDEPADVIHVTVPAERRGRGMSGVRTHQSIRAGDAQHPTRLPPQTRIEETVVDLTEAATTAEQAIAWIIRACARRLTTVERLRDAFAARKKLRWRGPIAVVLEDVQDGCQSMLELAYLRKVERAHGLPVAQRQVIRVRRGGRWYDDVRYTKYCTVVELDGQAAHPVDARDRDSFRDNAGAVAGLATLRYGPGEVVDHPCELAQQIGSVIGRNGWRGRLRRCGPTCRITTSRPGR